MNYQNQPNLESPGIDINNLPCPAFCKDKSFNYFNVNKSFLNFTGFDLNEVIEHDDYDLPWGKYANTYRCVDNHVLNKKSFAILEPLLTKNNRELTVVTRKSAITNPKGETSGILGLITIVSDKKIIKSARLLESTDRELTALSNLTPNSYAFRDYPERYQLSKREQECLFYILRGKTAKETARALDLSFRTIQFYTENIKNKFVCRSKSELIAKAIEAGFLNIIPSTKLFDHFE